SGWKVSASPAHAISIYPIRSGVKYNRTQKIYESQTLHAPEVITFGHNCGARHVALAESLWDGSTSMPGMVRWPCRNAQDGSRLLVHSLDRNRMPARERVATGRPAVHVSPVGLGHPALDPAEKTRSDPRKRIERVGPAVSPDFQA